ncbi:MAG: hypothetical protein IJU61_12600, partial [Victivallales bacterium]|nr:hypothetical protein [Victivallales bacterium]
MKLKVLGIVILVVVLVHALFAFVLMRHGNDGGGEQVVEKDLENDVEKPEFQYDDSAAAPVAEDSGLPEAHYYDGYYEMALAEMPAKLSQEINKCKSGICVDLTNKKVLWAKNEQTAGCIASMTKMMT